MGFFWAEEQYDTEIQDASLMTFRTSELQMYHPVLLLRESLFTIPVCKYRGKIFQSL